MSSRFERFDCHVQRIVLAQEDDLGFWRDFPYLPRSLDPAYSREADVQQHHIWTKFVSFPDRIFTGRGLANYVQCGFLSKKGTNRTADNGMIVYYEKP
jgi:hypothetical protein